MSGLKEIKGRIKSVSSTIQITSAMKMVSAAKLKSAQDNITKMRPYANKLHEILQNLCVNLDEDTGARFVKNKLSNTSLMVVILSNKGLCGSFNSNVIKELYRQNNERKGKYDIITIGKKAYDILQSKYTIVSNESDIWNDLTYKQSDKIAESIIQKFLDGVYSSVYLIYNQFKNAATQNLKFEQYLPIQLPKNKDISNTDYIFEPEKNKLIETIIPQYLKLQLFKALRDSLAGEHGARMTAMHKATDNANALLKELKLTYNKARQAAITNEILEIVSGAEALNG